MDVVRDFRRGAVRLHVLHHAAADPVSGVWLSDELRHHGHEISPGTLYPLLHDLESQGLLISRQRTDDGRSRRFYEATSRGRAVLVEACGVLAELADELLPAAGPRAGGTGRRHARSGR